jgi:hypothetical protein
VVRILEQPWAQRCRLVVCTLGAAGCVLVIRNGCTEKLHAKLPPELETATEGSSSKDDGLWENLEADIEGCAACPEAEVFPVGDGKSSEPLTIIR